jgi:uncharacterized protein (DUF58 family)
MKSRWTQIRAWLRERIRERLTAAGLLFSLATALVGAGAFLTANNLLFLLMAVMLSALLVAGFLGKLSLAGLEVDLILPDHISARRTIKGKIRVRNQKKWMSSFSLEIVGSPEAGFTQAVYMPSVPRGGAAEDSIEVRFNRRGLFKSSSFRVSSRFPFGFTERRVDVVLGGEILVYPALESQPELEHLLSQLSGEIEQHFRGRSHDFYRIRPYEAGESARHVDWRATAHTGELQVREFAREQQHLIELFFDLDVPLEQREWFEKAVECAAFLAWRISERAARIHFRTQDFDHRVPESCDIYTILKYLALVEPRPGAGCLHPASAYAFRVVVTRNPERCLDAGWLEARILSHWNL